MMTVEQLSAYIRLPYENLIKNQLQIISTFSNFSGQKQENYKGGQEEKLVKLCQPTCFLYQNKYYLDNDEENIWKKPTNSSQTPHKKHNRSNSQERHSRHIS